MRRFLLLPYSAADSLTRSTPVPLPVGQRAPLLNGMAQDYREEQLVKNNIESERGLPPMLECKITVRA
jgi:hypothetical protein